MRLINFTEELRGRESDFHRLHPMLQAVFFDAAQYVYGKWGKALLVTSMFRDTEGVHRYGRGLDVDVCDKAVYMGGILPEEAIYIVELINMRYEYDPKRPRMRVAIYGDLDPNGKHWNHIHFQVHDRTVAI